MKTFFQLSSIFFINLVFCCSLYGMEIADVQKEAEKHIEKDLELFSQQVASCYPKPLSTIRSKVNKTKSGSREFINESYERLNKLLKRVKQPIDTVKKNKKTILISRSDAYPNLLDDKDFKKCVDEHDISYLVNKLNGIASEYESHENEFSKILNNSKEIKEYQTELKLNEERFRKNCNKLEVKIKQHNAFKQIISYLQLIKENKEAPPRALGYLYNSAVKIYETAFIQTPNKILEKFLTEISQFLNPESAEKYNASNLTSKHYAIDSQLRDMIYELYIIALNNDSLEYESSLTDGLPNQNELEANKKKFLEIYTALKTNIKKCDPLKQIKMYLQLIRENTYMHFHILNLLYHSAEKIHKTIFRHTQRKDEVEGLLTEMSELVEKYKD